MNTRATVIILILLTALLGGAVAPLGKIALTEVPAFSFTFIRFALASLVLLPFYLRVRTPIGKDFPRVFCISLFAMANVVLFSFGIQRTHAGVAQALYTLSPLLAACLSLFLFRTTISRAKVVGVLIGCIGAFLITFLPFFEQGSGTITLFGNMLIVCAVIFVTLHTLYSKPLQRTYHPIEITSFFCFTTVGILFVLSLFDLQTHPFWWANVHGESVLGIIYAGLVGTALYYLLVQYIVKHSEPVLTSMVLYIQPFATIVWANLFLHETISLYFLFGIVLTLVGVWISTHQNINSS